MRHISNLFSKWILCAALALAAVCFSSRAFAEEEEFFSYERFFLNQALVDRIPSTSRAQEDVRQFSEKYTRGIYKLSSGDLDEAEKDLTEARKIWPEYFGTDFLLALVYEEKGDYTTASRYYKSYLNKLRNYQSGNYRISAPLIFSITSFEIEPYDYAHKMVENRLALQGLDLGGVSPMFATPTFIIPILSFSMIIFLCLISYYRIWPYIKREYRRHNPPEGFWICSHCDNANTDLDKECQECRRPRE